MAAAPKRVREQDFPFTYERSTGQDGDGLTFEGYAAVFNTPAHIRDSDGEYDEIIMPGAFRQTISGRKPLLMYNHGKHPVIADHPLGNITEIREDARGLFVRARLTDNWLVSPVRDAVADGTISGMSFRFEPVKETWAGKASAKCRHGDLRQVREVRCPELGPVVSPAYMETTAAVRSCFRDLEAAIPGVIHVQLLERDGLEVDTDPASPQDAVEEAIEQLWGLSDYNSDVYVQDFRDDAVVFYVFGADQSEYSGLWQVDYSYDNGTINLGTPQRVKASGFVPVGNTPPKDLGQWDPNLNSAPIEGEERAYSADDRKKMAAAGTAMADGSYPIANKADLQNAISAVGRGSGSHNAIRKHIMKRAKALGAADMIPNNWNSDGSMSGMNSQDISTSDEAAIDGTSEEAAATVRKGPNTLDERERTMRRIQLERRGINPRKDK